VATKSATTNHHIPLRPLLLMVKRRKAETNLVDFHAKALWKRQICLSLFPPSIGKMLHLTHRGFEFLVWKVLDRTRRKDVITQTEMKHYNKKVFLFFLLFTVLCFD